MNDLKTFFLDAVCLEKELALSTIDQIAMTIKAFEEWHGGRITWEELTPATMNRWIIDQAKTLAPKTIKRRRGEVLSVWRYAANEHRLCPAPKRIRSVRVDRVIPDAWTQEEWQAMLAAARSAQGVYRSGLTIAAWWELFLRVTYDTGLRLDDVFRLPARLVENSHLAMVQHKTRDGHIVRLSSKTIALGHSTTPQARKLLLPWHLGRKSFWNHWRRYISAPSAIKVDRRNYAQKIRRTSASHLEAVSPGAAMHHLGHKTPGLAQRHYIDPTIAYGLAPLPPDLDSVAG